MLPSQAPRRDVLILAHLKRRIEAAFEICGGRRVNRRPFRYVAMATYLP